ncbi:cutinase-domain-containing protein [Echria macrotheca]|uniref:cutinase n=1 Tax=Echria macrotheca TaxID=438768 RepID=A0AAJ0BEX4_9PEZI|nr:cutinase-domain-containing protein [Echria macrotheca]
MKPVTLLIPFAVLGLAFGQPTPRWRATPFQRSTAKAADTSLPLNTLLSWIAQLFPVNVVVQEAGALTTAAETVVAFDFGIETTRDIVSGGPCANVTILFARGTSEVGNVGVLVGPVFFDAVADRLVLGSTLSVQGVDYDADIPGFLEGGDPRGSRQMAADVTRLLAACPDTHLVMAGYSQGGQIVHNAAQLVPATDLAKVSAVVIFGDPYYPAAVVGIPLGKQRVICHAADDICGGGDMVLLSHLTYAGDADAAAGFVADLVLSGLST